MASEISEIKLSKEETAEILQKARRLKFDQQQKRNYWEKVNADVKIPKFSDTDISEVFFERYVKIVSEKTNGGEFTLEGFKENVFYSLCKYFNGSAGTLNTNKGILLVGGIGVGKSTLIDVFTTNPLQGFYLKSCRDIAYDYSKEGKAVIDSYSVRLPRPFPFNPFQQQASGICFDDLGTETLKKFFGNESNVMADILLNRYDRVPFNQTFITTNLDAQQIKDFYGDRLASRFKEMFNIIEFPIEEKDLRK